MIEPLPLPPACHALESAAALDGIPATAAAPAPPELSPELCRLLNAAAVDPVFGAALLAAPSRAAAGDLCLAALDGLDGAGGGLPDPLLRLPPIHLAEAERALLRRLPPGGTLAEAWQFLVAGAAPAAVPPPAPPAGDARFERPGARNGAPAAGRRAYLDDVAAAG